jgi:hypothetical protein
MTDFTIPPPPGATEGTSAEESAQVPEVGQVVTYSLVDGRGDTITNTGVVVDVTDDGAYVALLGEAAVVPLDQLTVH